MRSKGKKEILALLHMLREADSKIEMLVQTDRRDLLDRLLETCQNTAISVGTAIEKEEGQNTKAVQLLEEYCEEMFLIFEIGKTDISGLDTILSKVEDAIESFPTCYVVVFMPYKASMWDSMESVWKAAVARQNCEAYVLPIPYYDRNSAGNLEVMHYEGTEFPTEVPVQNWQTFSVQQLHPDIIFIHNPYDQMNHATSIHPDFYSENLKKMTEQLVMLPYAVSSKEHAAEAFSVLPGILYADRVMVQSETLRREQISWFHKWEREYRCEGLFGRAEEKFRVFGSPKFDKAVSVVREEYEYPEEWEKKVRRADGSKKTAVLLNTSMNQFFHCEGIYLKKLQHILELFRKNTEILLVWRPHPLMEQTIRTMRPNLLEEYRGIVSRFLEENWGIYDESADLYRAVTFTDIYYGDWSSVATIYQCTGKPVILENFKAFQLGKLEYRKPLYTHQLLISSFSISGSELYLYDSIGDVIYRADLCSGKAEALAMLPHGKPGTPGYFYMEQVEDKLIMVPGRETDIILYHLDTGRISRIAKSGDEGLRFCCSFGRQLFFTPLSGGQMTRLDLEKEVLCRIEDATDREKLLCSSAATVLLSNGLPMALENKIFIPYRAPYGVAEFDCQEQRVIRYHDLPDCATMAFDGVKYWWCDRQGQLFCWDYENETSRLIHDFRADLEQEPKGLLVYFLAYAEDYLYLLPHQYHPYMENKAFRVHTKSLEIMEIPELGVPADGEIQPNKNLRCYCGIRMNERKQLYAYCNPRNTIVCIEPVSGEIREVPLRFDTGCMTNNSMHEYIQETQSLLLEYFLEYFGKMDGSEFEREKLKGLLETGAWKQIMLRNEKNGVQDIGLEYLDGKCGERIIQYLLQQLEEADR